MATNTRILSFDPGFDRLGWAIGTRTRRTYQLEFCGCIQTPRNSDLLDRYKGIIVEVQKLITAYQPTEAALETLFFSSNKTTAMRVSEVRGMLLSVLLQADIAISQYNPQQIKLTVAGSGSADKKAMQKMVLLQTNLSTTQVLDDTIDAIAVGMTHALLHNSP